LPGSRPYVGASRTHPEHRAASGPSLDLYYVTGGGYRPLPDWAKLFLAVGCLLASTDDQHSRLVAGLVLPVRSYAAALTAFGVVATRAYLGDSAADTAAHFAQLCRLPPGTPVSIQTDRRIKKGKLVGPEEQGGIPGLKVRIGREEDRWLPYDLSYRIWPRSEALESLPLTQHGRSLTPATEFVRNILRDTDTDLYPITSRLDCIIAGSVQILRDEVTQKCFAIRTAGSEFETGSLQDVLRVKKFLKDGEGYRSDILSVHTNTVPKALTNSGIPAVVVFDGALGFLKWRSSWPRSNLAVLLARTDPRLVEAVQELNRPVSFRNCSVLPSLRYSGIEFKVPSIPKGIELMVYREEI
jgi:hypothetical protein